jgi:predicted dehydrogenase
MDTLRAAVIGLGVGQQHILGYMRHPDCSVTFLCDIDENKLEYARERYPGIRLTKKADDIFKDPSIDVVSIASFDQDHADQILRALEAGKHVFSEKPLCQTPQQLEMIKEKWTAHGGRIKLGCNLVLRAAPLYQYIRAQILQGVLGTVYSFDGEYLYGRLNKITDGWRGDVTDYSVMQGGGIHMIDLMLWLTGERPDSVFCLGNRICTEGTPFRYDDYMTSLFEFPSGMIGRITANFGCVHRHQHVVRIYGTKGTFLYDDAGPRLYLTRDPAVGPTYLDDPPLPSSKGDLIPDFASAIIENKDINRETQIVLDGISISNACDSALRHQRQEKIHYL